MRRVKHARRHTVIVDEVTDTSNKEQLSLVLRYVDPDMVLLQEDLVDFIECDSSITGQALAAKILASLNRYSTELNLMRSQCYDGASNMAGTRKGAATIIICQFKHVLYLHCALCSDSPGTNVIRCCMLRYYMHSRSKSLVHRLIDGC